MTMKTKSLSEQEVTAAAKEVKLAGGRGKETLFRVSCRNQIELIAIADNKANMITGINAILVSLIIAGFGSGFRVDGESITDKVELVIPFAILLTFCLFSAILAILAARPMIIRSSRSQDVKKSLLFFDNFFYHTLEDYIREIKGVLQSRDLIYEQMIIDMYNNGKVLKRKYWLLGIAYTLFMVGIVSCVISFIIVFL